VLLLAVLLFAGCSSQRKVEKFLNNQLQFVSEGEQFTGVFMVDISREDTLFALNKNRYFTPASNIKVFTLYAALKELPDRVPALKYMIRSDTLHVLGTGDPSALHPTLGDSTALEFLMEFEHIVYYPGTLAEPAWGTGWAWDDFDRYYMADRSSLPIYGNVLQLIRTPDSLRVTPGLFKDSIAFTKTAFRRKFDSNQFYYRTSFPDTVEIPLKLTPAISLHLWKEAVGRELLTGNSFPEGTWSVLSGMPADSLYREMMTVSDNFLAEQLMLMVSASLGDSLSFAKARDHVMNTHLSHMPSPPRWVDGSGLSRYNLMTPESMVYLLVRLYKEIPEERLFSLLAKGGKKGTLEDWYTGPDGPYLFGKTGSLSNNHNLCGYLRTRSGKTVAFSFMNNHYRKPTNLVKSRMQRLLNWVRDNY
jgi:D-alanyl-D-alanine carboxypeptidase/D-alanyl-D-alanine-endopeptidase (penicillin-binding protein 4)